MLCIGPWSSAELARLPQPSDSCTPACPPPGPDNGCCPHLLIFLPGTLFLLLMLYNFWFFLILQCLKALDQLSCRIFLDVGLSVPMLIRFG